MMCPHCNEPLILFELGGIEIDHCVACRGTWLDSGELEMITELAGVSPGRLTEALRSAKSGKKAKRRCPRCNRRLRQIHLSAGAAGEIELDECPLGHGLWFDRGEMKAAIQAFDDGEEGLVAQFFQDLFHAELESPQEQDPSATEKAR